MSATPGRPPRRVLVLTQHFTPEVTAGRFRLESFASALVERGHAVEVICPVPNHPRGIVEEGYRHRLVLRRRVNGARVSYMYVLTAREKTFSRRLGYYVSYAALASAAGALRRRPDVILASSPPLSVAAVGALLAVRHRTPWILDVRDLWPQSALALGELRSGRLLRAAERLERLVYRRADLVVTTNESFRRWIEERASAGTRVEVIPNGTTRAWLGVGAEEVARPPLGLPDDRFVWAYAGNIGLAHGIEHAVDAAGLLGDGYLLLVIGEGTRRQEIERRAAQAPAHTVDLRGLMPAPSAARYLRAANALLVSERQEMTISAKLYDACAIGRPLVVACRGELLRLVEREEIGLAVPHGDAEALAEAVRRLRSEPELCERLGARARKFALAHLRERHAERLARLVESLAVAR